MTEIAADRGGERGCRPRWGLVLPLQRCIDKSGRDINLDGMLAGKETLD